MGFFRKTRVFSNPVIDTCKLEIIHHGMVHAKISDKILKIFRLHVYLSWFSQSFFMLLQNNTVDHVMMNDYSWFQSVSYSSFFRSIWNLGAQVSHSTIIISLCSCNISYIVQVISYSGKEFQDRAIVSIQEDSNALFIQVVRCSSATLPAWIWARSSFFKTAKISKNQTGECTW